jgi:signal transduction histidine kinase
VKLISATMPVTALLDVGGHIVHADEPLRRLQIEAGGEPKGSLALPALAALVRLAMRLRVPLSRTVELASSDADISLWVEILPRVDGIHLTLLDWQERRPRRSLSHVAALCAEPEPEHVVGWDWQVDEHLRFGETAAEASNIGHEAPVPGESFTGYFILAEAPEPSGRGMPMLEALARHAGFEDQLAQLRFDPAIAYRLSAMATFSRDGRFSGFRGFAERTGPARMAKVERSEPSQPAAVAIQDRQQPVAKAELSQGEFFAPALGRRLDQALRAPIDRIIANAEAISGCAKGPLRQDYVNYSGDIAGAGRHLLALVDDIADLQAIERPGFRTADEEVDLAELARRAAGLLNMRAESRNIRIQVPAHDEQLRARAEYRRVLQILVNLVGNAVRHSPPDSTIWLRLDEEDGRVRVIVADQGGGIDPSDHGRVFERFERLGNTDGEGSGLGLYISRRLARAMGGDLTIDSILGTGARFTLELPSWQARQSDSIAS